jgi:hypothetical protein
LGIVCSSEPVVVAGSWKKGAAAYDASTGQCLWSRRDLKYIQYVQDLSNEYSLVVGIGLEDAPYHILRADTGENTSKLANIAEVYPSFFDPLYLLVGVDKTVHLSAELRSPSIWKKVLVSFAILHAAFSPTQVAYSESAGWVYCFDFYGTEIWRLQPEPDHHIMRLIWDSARQQWLAIKWNYQHGGPKSLLEIDAAGNARVIASIGDRWLAEFLPSGRHIITSKGEVISTDSGESVWKFADCAVVPHGTK